MQSPQTVQLQVYSVTVFSQDESNFVDVIRAEAFLTSIDALKYVSELINKNNLDEEEDSESWWIIYEDFDRQFKTLRTIVAGSRNEEVEIWIDRVDIHSNRKIIVEKPIEEQLEDSKKVPLPEEEETKEQKKQRIRAKIEALRREREEEKEQEEDPDWEEELESDEEGDEEDEEDDEECDEETTDEEIKLLREDASKALEPYSSKVTFETAFSKTTYPDRLYFSDSECAHGGHSTFCGKHLPTSWSYDPTITEIPQNEIGEFDYCLGCLDYNGGIFTEEYAKTMKSVNKKLSHQ